MIKRQNVMRLLSRKNQGKSRWIGRARILYIIDYFHRTGGTEKHLVDLISGLPPEEFECAVVVFDLGVNPLLDVLRSRGVPVIHLAVGREYVQNAARQAWHLSRLIRTNRYDIVQTFHQKADSYGALVARLSGTRHLVSSKRDTGQLRRPRHFFINRRLRGLFEAFIVVADAVGVAVMKNDGLPASRILKIYNGVDTSRFSIPSADQRQAARTQLGFSADDFVVGMVAGFRPEKNHDVFFAGLSQALADIPALKVLAVGGGPLLETFRDRIAATPLGERTVFTGDVADVVPSLWAMNVSCLTPSSNEGFSNAVIEQMAVGLPVVATDVGGNAEAVVQGETGYLICPGDSGALTSTLVDLYRGRERLSAMGQASRRRVEAHFSREHMCTEHARLYRRLLGARDVQ